MRAVIDRLVLDVPGLDPAGAERLAARIGAGLGEAEWDGPPVRRALSAVRLDGVDDDLDALADRVVAQLLAQWG